MERKPGTQTVCGVEILPEQRTPLVEALLRVIDQLQATNAQLRATVQQQQLRIDQLEEEVRRLKGLPDQPKRKPSPSPLNDPSGPPSASGEKKKPNTPDGKRPGSAKRSKTRDLIIHKNVPLLLDGLPDGTRFLGYQDFTVQDLRVEPYNTRYRRGRYQLPDGTIVTAPLPQHVKSHFGPTLRQYVLYQHFHNHVTQPLLHEELLELGVDISAGQVNRLLTEGHEAFYQEKDSLLPAAREVSAYLQTDDTSARHRGKAGHTLHIGNDLFASFFTTEHQEPGELPEDSAHASSGLPVQRRRLVLPGMFRAPQKLLAQLRTDTGWLYEDDASWEAQLDAWEITSAEHRRLLTEGALWANLLAHDLYSDLVFVSDDAAQFKLLAFLHALCWVHMERHVAQLIPLTADQACRTRSGAGRDLGLLPATEGLS